MDIKCVVCGEPWDAYGVNHGDMLPWEAKLFKAGAGCPSCEGVSNGYEPATMSDIENGDEDPIERIHARQDHENGQAPRWKRPEDPILWTCDGCGVQAVKDIDSSDGDAFYRVPYKSKAHSWYCSHPFAGREADEEPAHTFESGETVCEFCLSHCDHCGEAVCTHIEDLAGYYMQGHDATLCSDDCLSAWEHEEANLVWKDCYSADERIEYVRKHRDQFEFRSFADMLGCIRGNYFAGDASELIG